MLFWCWLLTACSHASADRCSRPTQKTQELRFQRLRLLLLLLRCCICFLMPMLPPMELPSTSSPSAERAPGGFHFQCFVAAAGVAAATRRRRGRSIGGDIVGCRKRRVHSQNLRASKIIHVQEGGSAVGAMFDVASRRELPEGGQDGKIAMTAKSC